MSLIIKLQYLCFWLWSFWTFPKVSSTLSLSNDKPSLTELVKAQIPLFLHSLNILVFNLFWINYSNVLSSFFKDIWIALYDFQPFIINWSFVLLIRSSLISYDIPLDIIWKGIFSHSCLLLNLRLTWDFLLCNTTNFMKLSRLLSVISPFYFMKSLFVLILIH